MTSTCSSSIARQLATSGYDGDENQLALLLVCPTCRSEEAIGGP
jgi:hypothetical protein